MSIILNIDTATERASVCISENGRKLLIKNSENQKEHASFIHIAIEGLLKETNIRLNSVDAIAVTSGPGSYTGLRVGMATAKGFCYALSKPLITVGTLEAMAISALIENNYSPDYLYCPMIDARRLEVFTAVYNNQLQQVVEPGARVLEEETFDPFIREYKVLFFGSGSMKYNEMIESTNAFFSSVHHSAEHVRILAHKAFEIKQFANLSNSQPEYLKEFHTIGKK